jgi:SAM-dependent methyltransferase
VQKNYDFERAKLMASIDSLDWDTYVNFPAENADFIVLDDKIRWGTLREVRKLLLTKLSEAVETKVQAGQTVIEFGSGDGRNLLYLRKRFPDINFVGLELSPVSVEFSKKAAEQFGVEGVAFYQANACVPLPVNIIRPNIALIYTSFALEQMPVIFREALHNMLELSPSSIVLFEPIPEVWGWGLRGIVSRLRVRVIDRLRHLPSVLNELLESHPKYELKSIKRSGLAINPHTEMCEVLIQRKQ